MASAYPLIHMSRLCVPNKSASHVNFNVSLSSRKSSFTTCSAAHNDADHQVQAGDQTQKSTNLISMHPLDNVIKPVLKFASDNFLPFALISGVMIGLAYPKPGCFAQRYSLAKVSTCGLFFVSGLTLKTEEIYAAMEAWPVGAFGVVSILLCTPLISKLVLQLQLTPPELVKGLAIFCCMPTTLSSGIALTQLVGGNKALAILMTVVSNLLGILTVPFNISGLFAQDVGISIPTGGLLKSLILTLLLPLLIGKGFRSAYKGVAAYVDRHRLLFSMLNSILLSLVPWMQVSGSRALLLSIPPMSFIFVVMAGMATHAIFLAWNTAMIWIISVLEGKKNKTFAKKSNSRAVIIVASQKTLPVLIAILGQLGNVLGEAGLLVIPCVAAHLSQIIIDSFLVKYWLQSDEMEPSK